MNIKDDSTTSGTLERLQHRKANRVYNNNNNNNSDYRQNRNGSSSRERNSDFYANPSAPPPAKQSKYANIMPM